MERKRILSLLLALTLVLALLTGCGSSSSTRAVTNYAAADSAAEIAEAAAVLEESGAGGELTQPENRKWIVTVDIHAETEDLDALLSALTEQIAAMAGYVEDQSIYNGSAYSTRRYRSADLTIRIPAEDVDDFTQAVSGVANVISSSKNLEDVTLQYSDTETRVKALETEQTRLLELMESAENMADLLEIESRLTEVRYELERYSSRLKLYDNQIDYATIDLDIQEVQEYTPTEEPTFWQRIRDGFLGSLKGLGNGAVDALVWVIATSPYLVVLAAAACLLLRLLRRHKARKQQKKEAKKEE